MPNAEQTASLFSFLTFIFMDSVVYKASQVEHLKLDEFPPLCDYDAAKNLVKQGYPVSTIDHVLVKPFR